MNGFCDILKCILVFLLFIVAFVLVHFAVKDMKLSQCEIQTSQQLKELNASLNDIKSQLNAIETKIQTQKIIYKVTKPKKTECPSVNFYCSPNVFQNPYLPLFMRYGVKGIDNELD